MNNYEELKLYRNKIVECYCFVYKDYKFLPPVSLDSKNDVTLDFVNCTICGAKDNLYNSTIGEDYIMVQPCLRNNHIDILKNRNQSINYMGYFTMIGGFCYIDNGKEWVEKINEIVLKQFSFFRMLYEQNFIRLTIPIHYKEFLPLTSETMTVLKNNNCEIMYSETDQENLKWKYGISGIEGYGTRWEILNSKKEFVNCGNDIVLFKNGMAIGIDFGSGLETLVSVTNGKQHLLYSNIVCSDLVRNFCNGNCLNEKFIDSLTSLLCIEYYKEYHSFRINYTKKMYIKIISAICVINNINEQLLCLLMEDICKNINVEHMTKNILILREIIEQKNFLYKISDSKNVVKLLEGNSKNICELKGYNKNIFDIEIGAIEFIREREFENEKTKKIKKGR